MDIRPIRSPEDHAQALREIERLWGFSPGTPEADQLDVLSTLVDAYERQLFPIHPEVNHYLFMIGWVEDKAGAKGEKTNIERPEDLIQELVKGNSHVYAVHIEAPSSLDKKFVLAIGYKEAFDHNYTARDSVSCLMSIVSDFRPAQNLKTIIL